MNREIKAIFPIRKKMQKYRICIDAFLYQKSNFSLHILLLYVRHQLSWSQKFCKLYSAETSFDPSGRKCRKREKRAIFSHTCTTVQLAKFAKSTDGVGETRRRFREIILLAFCLLHHRLGIFFISRPSSDRSIFFSQSWVGNGRVNTCIITKRYGNTIYWVL